MDQIISGKQTVWVQIEDQFSEVKTIDFSVPRGSILGPVLFTCYASTLQEHFTSHNSLSGYADDHSFIRPFSPTDHKLLWNLSLTSSIYVIGCIRITSKWIMENRVYHIWKKIMPKKAILFRIRVGNDVVKGSDSIKFLGIILGKELDKEKIHST